MVMTHFDFIWRSLRSFGVAQMDADDAAQHVFWIASQKLDSIAVGSERSFLFATARGVGANVRRARLRKRETLDEMSFATLEDQGSDPEEYVQRREAVALLEEVLDQMPDELRVVFVLFELEGLTSIDIGEMLRIPTGTAASRLRRARAAFRKIASTMARPRTTQ